MTLEFLILYPEGNGRDDLPYGWRATTRSDIEDRILADIPPIPRGEAVEVSDHELRAEMWVRDLRDGPFELDPNLI